MSILKDEKVIVQFINNTKNGITDKRHNLYGGMSNKACVGIPAPRNINSIFSKEELEELEKAIGEDLNYKSDFWKEFRTNSYGGNVGIFPIVIYKEGMLLNKANPIDYIKIKCLENSPIIAKNHKDAKARKSEVRFVLLNQNNIHSEDIKNINSKMTAMKLYMQYQEKEDILRYLLRSFGKGVTDDHSLEFLKKEAWKIMEFNTEAFNTTLEDELLNTKIDLYNLVKAGLINKTNNFYFDLEGNKLAIEGELNDIDGASRYLNSGLGKELKNELLAKSKAMKSKVKSK